jgi:hypothetical protein
VAISTPDIKEEQGVAENLQKASKHKDKCKKGAKKGRNDKERKKSKKK